MARIISYRSSRMIRSDQADIGAVKASIVQGLNDFRLNNDGVSYRENGRSTTVTVNEVEIEAWRGTIRLEMKTTLEDEAADRETLAQQAVDLGFSEDKATAKENISTRTR